MHSAEITTNLSFPRFLEAEGQNYLCLLHLFFPSYVGSKPKCQLLSINQNDIETEYCF